MAKEESPEVLMIHKDFKDREPARVTRGAFNKLWKENGWSEVEPDSKQGQTVTSTPLESGVQVEG